MVAKIMMRTYEIRIKIGFDDSFDVTKCLQQIKNT